MRVKTAPELRAALIEAERELREMDDILRSAIERAVEDQLARNDEHDLEHRVVWAMDTMKPFLRAHQAQLARIVKRLVVARMRLSDAERAQ